MAQATATKARAVKAGSIAKSIKAPAGSSTIANLEARTTPQAAGAARTEGLNTGSGTNFSGQYLFDRIIVNNKEDQSLMDMVRQMVKQLDTASFKSSVNDFVVVAKGYVDNAIEQAKTAGGFDEKNPPAPVQMAQARYKTAKNHQTVLRTAYGALKFCADELTASGYTEQTGYQMMRVIGIKALATKGIKWDGSKADAPEVKAQRARTAQEGKAMAQAMADNPKHDDEDRATYFARIDTVVESIIKAEREEQHTQAVAKLVARIKSDAGALLPEVLEALMTGDEPAPAALH